MVEQEYFLSLQHNHENLTNMLKRLLFLLAVLLTAGTVAFSQVTTSGITGTIKGPDNGGLAGATVKATHAPSGTVYTTITTGSGVFSIQGMRPGGPYTIEVSFVGLAGRKLDNVFLTLGESYVLNDQLTPTSTELSTVVVTGATRTSRLNRDKTGAATNISTQQITSLPTLNRSITDFTKLTPQANGNSFAGRDGRYNNVQVDGANFNNGFGLNDNPLPGGGGLSLDAIEEIQVNIAPYDVRQSGFSGAGINAITRSGTNRFVGSAYYYFRNQGLTGNKAKDVVIPKTETSSKTIGARIGGPIIKNKLFFFLNAERIENKGNNAGAVNLWTASENGVADPDRNIARPRRSDLEAVRNHLINQWGYDPGRYEGYALDNGDETTSILARVDWNINNKHRLAVRYNQVKSSTPSLVNGNSGPYPRSTTANRVSAQSMAFESTMYFTDNIVRSGTIELNSRLGGRWSNQLLGTYSRIQATRSSNSPSVFPMIDIGDGMGTSSTYVNYISAGYELFTYGNDVLNDNYSIVDNLTYTAGKHTLTMGASFEMQKFGNQYLRNGTSYYRYASVADFLTTGTPGEVAPIQFGLTYAYPGQDSYAPIKYALPSMYIQDNFTVTDRFTVMAGIRAEMPWFVNKLTPNPSVENLILLDKDGSERTYTTGAWPKKRVMLSPRVGFRWDVYGNKSLVVRGGTGIFAGRVPFVWLTNMPSNSGVIQNTIEPGSYAASAPWINDIRFNPDRLYWLNNTPASAQNVFIKSPNAGVPSSLALVDRDFKMPQIWRTSIGIDQTIPNTSLVFSADLMYTKDLQAVYQFGANRKPATAHMNYAGDNRDFYPNAAAYTFNPALGGNAGSVLTNTTKGHSFNLTAGLSLPARKGFFGSIFYSYTLANTTTDNAGSNASSAWGATPNINNPNDLMLASAQDALPHRIVANLSYRFEYLKALATTVSVYYNGANQGRFSFTYNGDLNGDAISADLLYIPRDASEINFTDITGNTPFTVAQQREAFNAYLSNVKYLDKNRGSYAERNGGLLPWLNRFDVKVLQDLFTNIGPQKNTLQLSLDIINFGNLLNKDWGIQKALISGANAPLTRASVTPDGVPTFRMNTVQVGGQTILPTSIFRDVTTLGTTWSMQIGIRYLFN